MKKLFKASLLVVALLMVMGISAQEKATQFGVKAGLNLSNFGGDPEDTKAKVGFNIGVTLDQLLAESFYLQTGLELTTKGAKVDDVYIEGTPGDVTINSIYLQLPIHVAYKLNVAENTKIVFFAGPYLAYGIGGKSSFKSGGNEYRTDVFQKGELKAFDLGLGGGLGVEFGKIGVNLGYDFGLANISDAGGTIKNQNAYLSLGYRF